MLEFFQTYSYLGLFIILFLEEGGVPFPIPSDLFIAAVAAMPNSNYFLIIPIVVLATLTGSTILFSISRKAGHYLIMRFGKYIRIDAQKVKKLESWFKKRGGQTIILGRLVPGFRTITPMVAGTFRVSYKTFWLNTFIAAFIWANIYYVIGKFFGEIVLKFIR